MRHSSHARTVRDSRTPRSQRARRCARTLTAFAATAGLVVASFIAASPASATDYPTWADVQRAKGNEQATTTEVQRVQAALKSAQAESAAKSQAALTATTAASQAESELNAAAQSADALQARAATASATAARAKRRAGQLAANLYRDGSTSGSVTSRIASSTNPEQLLYQLGTLDQLSSTWAGVLDDASVAANTATSLHNQATRAETARRQLAVVAEQKAAAAKSASNAAASAVASTQSHSNELYSQLATLKNTTAQVEKNYELGVQVAAQKAAIARANAAAAAAAAAAARASTTTTTTTTSSSASSAPSTAGVSANPTAAKAYARSAMSAYGWGSDQYSCLVQLWTMESGWRADALNSSSGAYGIPQALPGTKMAVAGADWRTNQNTQIDWGLAYIKSAYTTPCGAWNHEMSVNPHWY